MSGEEFGKGIFQKRNLTVRKKNGMAQLRYVRRGVREGYVAGKDIFVRRLGWLTLDMSGEESGKSIYLSGKWDDSP
jgi:hypothetical protein